MDGDSNKSIEKEIEIRQRRSDCNIHPWKKLQEYHEKHKEISVKEQLNFNENTMQNSDEMESLKEQQNQYQKKLNEIDDYVSKLREKQR